MFMSASSRYLASTNLTGEAEQLGGCTVGKLISWTRDNEAGRKGKGGGSTPKEYNKQNLKTGFVV